MDTVHFEHRHLDLACELEEEKAGAQVDEWRSLRTRALQVEPIPGGVRMWLPADAWAAAEDLARRESACCGFLDLELAPDGDRVRLDLTSEVAAAAPLIASLVGVESEPRSP